MSVAFGAEACRGIVREWCVNYNMQQAFSLSGNLYDPEVVPMICEEWCRRYKHFYDIWVRAGSDFEYRYSEVDLQSYVPPVAWLEMCAGLTMGSAAYRRCQAIDMIAPLNP